MLRSFLTRLATYCSAVLIGSVRFPKRPRREIQKLTIRKGSVLQQTIEGGRYVKRDSRVSSFTRQPAWGVGGGILTLLAVFGDRIFP